MAWRFSFRERLSCSEKFKIDSFLHLIQEQLKSWSELGVSHFPGSLKISPVSDPVSYMVAQDANKNQDIA